MNSGILDAEVDWGDSKIGFFSRIAENKKVLDIGVVQHEMEKVGKSTWLHRALCLKAKEIVGLDIDQEGVTFLNENNYKVICADAQNFQLNDSFDVIVAGDLIEHLDNPGGFLECAKKHLTRDGILAISTPNPFWWKTFVHVLVKGNSNPHPEHTCWYCRKTITQLLARHGFVVERFDYGTVYILTTFYQRLTKLINSVAPLPDRFRHNTIMLVARLK